MDENARNSEIKLKFRRELVERELHEKKEIVKSLKKEQ